MWFHSRVGVARLGAAFVLSVLGVLAVPFTAITLDWDAPTLLTFTLAMACGFAPLGVFVFFLVRRPWALATTWCIEGSQIRYQVPAPRNGSMSKTFSNVGFVTLVRGTFTLEALRTDGTRAVLPKRVWKEKTAHAWKLGADGRLSIEPV